VYNDIIDYDSILIYVIIVPRQPRADLIEPLARCAAEFCGHALGSRRAGVLPKPVPAPSAARHGARVQSENCSSCQSESVYSLIRSISRRVIKKLATACSTDPYGPYGESFEIQTPQHKAVKNGVVWFPEPLQAASWPLHFWTYDVPCTLL